MLNGGGWLKSSSGRFSPGVRDPIPIVQKAGWAPTTVRTGAANLAPTGIRSPDRPARSESLYRLSYPGPRPLYNLKTEKKNSQLHKLPANKKKHEDRSAKIKKLKERSFLKLFPMHAMKKYGGMVVQFQAFSTSALDAGEIQAHVDL